MREFYDSFEKQALSSKFLTHASRTAERKLSRAPIWNLPKRMKLKRQANKFYKGSGQSYNKEHIGKLKKLYSRMGFNTGAVAT